MDCAFKGLLWTQVLEFLSCSDYIYKELRRNKGMTVVFAKQERSEPDFYIQESEIRKGAVLSDPGHVCKYNWYASSKSVN